jgi:hypothetical protein
VYSPGIPVNQNTAWLGGLPKNTVWKTCEKSGVAYMYGYGFGRPVRLSIS